MPACVVLNVRRVVIIEERGVGEIGIKLGGNVIQDIVEKDRRSALRDGGVKHNLEGM
jgi:hypothetical protein